VAKIVVPTPNTTITSAWGKSVADALNNVFAQGAVQNVSIPAADGYGTITFPTPFLAVPFAVTANVSGGGGTPGAYLVSIGLVTATTAQFRVFVPPATPAGPGSLNISWIAIGLRA